MNKIRYGLKNVSVFPLTETTNASTGAVTYTYGDAIPWPGARSLSLSPEGGSTTYYADDTEYFVTSTNNGYTGTLTMAKDNDEFKKTIMGYKESAAGGLVEDAAALPKSFGMTFQCEGDESGTAFQFFKVTPSRSSFNANTKEAEISPDEDTLDITVTAVESTDGANKWVSHAIPATASGFATALTELSIPTKKTS